MPIEQRDGYRLWVGGPVPRGSGGITLPGLVIVRSGQASPYLLRHELVHVRQWRRFGVVGFGVRYVGAYLHWRIRGVGHAGAYRRIPMEIEADWVARRSLSTAVRGEPAAHATQLRTGDHHRNVSGSRRLP